MSNVRNYINEEKIMVVVNNAAPQTDSGNGMGFLMGVVLLIIFVVLLIYYGLPMIQRSTAAPQINVPDKVDVNVQQK
ncbi:MAG: hypothetical protein ABIO02_04610 [Patescibacteria group bacterium]